MQKHTCNILVYISQLLFCLWIFEDLDLQQLWVCMVMDTYLSQNFRSILEKSLEHAFSSQRLTVLFLFHAFQKEDPLLHSEPADSLHRYQYADCSYLLLAVRQRGENISLYFNFTVVEYFSTAADGDCARYVNNYTANGQIHIIYDGHGVTVGFHFRCDVKRSFPFGGNTWDVQVHTYAVFPDSSTVPVDGFPRNRGRCARGGHRLWLQRWSSGTTEWFSKTWKPVQNIEEPTESIRIGRRSNLRELLRHQFVYWGATRASTERGYLRFL